MSSQAFAIVGSNGLSIAADDGNGAAEADDAIYYQFNGYCRTLILNSYFVLMSDTFHD